LEVFHFFKLLGNGERITCNSLTVILSQIKALNTIGRLQGRFGFSRMDFVLSVLAALWTQS